MPEAVETRKKARLLWITNPDEENKNNYHSVRQETTRRLRNKKKAYLKNRINELEENSKDKNIRDLYKGIREFKRGYQPQMNVMKDKNGDCIADSQGILNSWKDYFKNLLNVHEGDHASELVVHTAEPFIPDPSIVQV